jgi:PTH1 family peptidyl-tRNA hydrolase
MRLRIGVGHPGHKDLVTDYVLKRASFDIEQVMRRNIEDAADVMPILTKDGIEIAMTSLHTKTDA